ncbi:hypothetical protein, partial [uncultured Bradyrhizobium sp.]|uniref:hypothetical protein n=1 Tax=uncultured Bradyrhizobium sp. TaxID=199684 RepID=UPI0035CA9F88
LQRTAPQGLRAALRPGNAHPVERDIATRRTTHCVNRGLDPRIHRSWQKAFAKQDGLPGLMSRQ